ncbi:MAG: hypothetical protein RIT02_2641 [Planctomycetota bacterium]|jgi:hypothetical protein
MCLCHRRRSAAARAAEAARAAAQAQEQQQAAVVPESVESVVAVSESEVTDVEKSETV